MAPARIIAGLSSTILRLSVLIFLRLIPGHHFLPIILVSFGAYLITIYVYSDDFYEKKRRLEDAFPAAASAQEKSKESNREDEATLIGQSDIPAEPIIDQVDRSFFKTVLLGIPDWHEVDFSYFTIGVNVLVAILAVDFVFRAPLLYPSADLRFSRVGYVDSDSAKILFREPDLSQYPVHVYLNTQDTGIQTKEETVFFADEHTDYTYPITFEALIPDKQYHYELSNNLTGSFRTAPSQTHPNPANDKLTFITSSCMKANFPYIPFRHALALPGFTDLSTVIQSLSSPAAFILFLGDFIYVDVPLRLSSTIEHYRAEYRRVYASPSWKLPGISSVPWLHTLDDHEISNDWAKGNETDPFPAAADPYQHYHISVNPPTPPSTPAESIENTTYFQFSRGPASFFLLDTRRYRTINEPVPYLPTPKHSTPPSKSSTSWFSALTNTTSNANTFTHTYSMLGHAQLSSLLTYLSTPEPPHIHWKILTSSVPFTKNWRMGLHDSWGGYLEERQLILNAMHAAEAELGVRVVVLSGDRHEFGAIRFPPPLLQTAPSVAPATAATAAPADGSDGAANAPLSSQEEIAYDPTPQAGPHEFCVGPLNMFTLPFRTFRKVDGQDVAIKYLPDGTSKVGVVGVAESQGRGARRRVS